MDLKEILELSGMAVGTGVFALALNELKNQYINWADKNKFYDEDVKFEDSGKIRREEYRYFSGEGEY
jgi:hypothetical protein